jgi:hypothetical protein
MSKDFGKLKYIFELVKPGLVFAADPHAAPGRKQTVLVHQGKDRGSGG